MGHGVKIKSPRIAKLKVHSPKALHTAAAARKTSVHTSSKAHLSYRYGLPSNKKKVIPGAFWTHPKNNLTNKAKLFGNPGGLMPAPHLTKSVVGLTVAAGALGIVIGKPEILSWVINNAGSFGNNLGIALIPLGMVIGGGKGSSDGPKKPSGDKGDPAKDADVSKSAKETLAKLGDISAVRTLIEVLRDDPKAGVRKRALEALSKFGNDAEIDALKKDLKAKILVNRERHILAFASAIKKAEAKYVKSGKIISPGEIADWAAGFYNEGLPKEKRLTELTFRSYLVDPNNRVYLFMRMIYRSPAVRTSP